MSDKIKCRLCENEYGIKQFGMHVSRTHKIPYEEYAIKYWEDLPKWSPCEICGIICKDAYCSNECFRKGASIRQKGKKKPPRTKEHCNNLSRMAVERYKNKTNHPFYGKKHTTESKEKMAKSQTQWLEENGHWATDTHLSDETKQKISKTRKDRKLGIGEKNGMFGKTHTPEAIEKIFKHKSMNKLEKLVADWLTEHNIEYTFQFFINTDGVCKSYDFKLKDTDTIIEVHGDYWHGGSGVSKHHFDVKNTIKNDNLKKQMAIDKGYGVIVIWEHEIKENINILETIIK
jgi:G:T-mismatch repair DNA endonuclease (very short patch repair protein)